MMILLVLIIVATNADNQADLDDGVIYQAIGNNHHKTVDAINA